MLTNPWYNPQSTIAPGLTIYDLIEAGYDLGMDDYPIWDESKREWLNTMIVDRFLFREICAETPNAFIRYFNRCLRQSMMRLNVVFESNSTLQTHVDLLNNMEINETHNTISDQTETGNVQSLAGSEGSSDNHTTNSTNGEENAQSYTSTDPAVTMIGEDPVKYYDNGQRAQSVTSATDETTSISHETNNARSSEDRSNQSHTTESYQMNHKGHYGRTLTGAIREFMESYSDSLQLLFDDLEVCFIQIWRP